MTDTEGHEKYGLEGNPPNLLEGMAVSAPNQVCVDGRKKHISLTRTSTTHNERHAGNVQQIS